MRLDNFRPVSYEELLSRPLLPIDWLVEPLIAVGDFGLFYGPPGSMKTWGLIYMGLHVAAGCAWLGKFAVPAPHRVLYIDEEMNERTIQRRIMRLGLGAGFEGPIPFHAVSRAGGLFNAIDCEDLRKALEEYKATFDPEMVIIESACATLDGDENSARDVAAYWREVRGVFGNRTVIVSHHMRKQHPNDRSVVSERSSGSNYWPGGADTVCAITRRLKDTMRLEPVKTRDTEEPDPFNIQLVDDGPNSPVELRFGGFAKVKVGPPDLEIVGDLDRQILTHLETDPSQGVDMACVERWARTRNVSIRTIERGLDKLVKQGVVARQGKGKSRQWWLATSSQGDGAEREAA